jgi:uncharacterized protein (DUF1778 family)
MANKTERLHLRLTPEQDRVLRRAADARGEPISDYVLRHAVEAAEIDLADRRVFVAGAESWAALQDALERPPRSVHRLRRLLSKRSVVESS